MRQLRMSPEQAAAVMDWAKQQDDKPNWSEAVRRLVELGLLAKAPAEMKIRESGSRVKRAAKAADMAGQKIDQLDDKSASEEMRAQRKRRLIKGPSEFREMRSDSLKSTK